ncbi:hypothetical protein J2752_002843 [Halarchaeum rubridurum]|uniref:Sugar-specific transcriptional regulator TrmB n=1 Tax=Halarchaeum rubridurum TaxID=489911 RepID=A0A830G4K9_9EURY|nr:hypothetical protein [Halarchaeum rubridurum]MBP1955912.1 hypothetical protein [Halarchaeum rubridurum]GGM75330.1 hypothetical protein GCM10009017_26590 [Halarchaeum rubridurum]
MSEESPTPGPSSDADSDARSRWTAERTTFQRVYDVVTTLSSYETVSEIAEQAACSTDGARDALTQLVEMDIVETRGSRPAEYRRNEAYFRWKRIEDLARDHTPSELRTQIDELIEEDETLQERFDAPSPAAVSPSEFEDVDHEAIHDRWDALNRWRSIRHDIEVLQQAAHRAEQRRDTSDTASA